MSWQQRYLEQFYTKRQGWSNGTQEFHQLIGAYTELDSLVLELGPGPSNQTTEFLSKLSTRIDGIDIDPQIIHNHYLDQRIVYDGQLFPIPDEQYDVVVADYVLEHLEHPQRTLAEIARILKPEGVFLFRTPNLFHYVSLASYLTPQRVHLASARFVRGVSGTPDPYPTFYRMNTERRIRQRCREAGLQMVELRMVEKEPSYALFSRTAFLAGVAYERSVNSFPWLRQFRVNIFGVLRRMPSRRRPVEPAATAVSA